MDQIKNKRLGEAQALKLLGKTAEEAKVVFAFEKRNELSGRDDETVITFVTRA